MLAFRRIQIIFKGPALLVFNNSKFEEEDFESIRQIEKSKKYDKPLKIGKFGLGFNSIYHLTGKNSSSVFSLYKFTLNEIFTF